MHGPFCVASPWRRGRPGSSRVRPTSSGWPRGASLTDVLDPIPTRYTAVQALVRVFFPRPATDSPFHERMTVRPSLLDVGAEPEPLEWALRSVHRVRHDDIAETGDGRSVPLRAWYPIEVLRFPLRTPDQAAVLTRSASHESRSTLEEALLANPGGDASRRYGDMVVDDEAVQHGLDSGALVEDVRLRAISGRLAHTRTLRATMCRASWTRRHTRSSVPRSVRSTWRDSIDTFANSRAVSPHSSSVSGPGCCVASLGSVARRSRRHGR